VTLLVIDDTRDDLTVSDCDPHAATAPEAIVELRAPARTPSLKIIRDTVAEAARRAGCSPRTVADVSLAVDEACQNVIRHAYAGAPGEIVVAVERQTDDLVVHIRDFAREIDPAQVKPRDLEDLRPGGLGTHFIREVMDATDFLRPGAGTGNVLRLRKRIE
jgi:sigma-B regulation protein RsbU (phosphoserine phosphatase)